MFTEKIRDFQTEVLDNSTTKSSSSHPHCPQKSPPPQTPPQFETKEEYLSFLVERGTLKHIKNRKYTDGKLRFEGNLIIDKRVKSGLDWSDIEVTSAIVQSGLIFKYKYLPCTQQGVKTELRTTSLDEFIKHNACHATQEGERFIIKGTFRIPNIDTLPDFNRVTADTVLCYYSGRVNVARLPYAQNGIFGICADNIETQGINLHKTAKAKGLGKKICQELKKQKPSSLKKLLDMFSSQQPN